MSSPIAVPRGSTQQAPFPWGRLWLRLRVRGRVHKLDRALATGASPADSEELSLRADQLSSPEVRERLAGTYTRLSDESQGQIGLLPFHYDRVRINRGPLGEIADLLGGDGTLPIRGVALASALLDDRMGPLYANDVPADLAGTLKRILTALGR
jgi:hypothetical protein